MKIKNDAINGTIYWREIKGFNFCKMFVTDLKLWQHHDHRWHSSTDNPPQAWIWGTELPKGKERGDHDENNTERPREAKR